MTDGKDKKSFWDQPVVRKGSHSPAYSLFVRWMRLVLPLAAAAVIGVLVIWPDVEDAMVSAPAAGSAAAKVVAGQNELVNPRFESHDAQQRPYNITAARAVQSVKDPAVMLLETPQAEMILEDGTIAAEALRGAYRQNEENLTLEGGVTLRHALGYEIRTEALLVNMKAQKIWSDQAVAGEGPAGTLTASGLQADAAAGTLVFTGPAKLVLNSAIKGF